MYSILQKRNNPEFLSALDPVAGCKFSPFVGGLHWPFSKLFVPPYLDQGSPVARIRGDLARVGYTVVRD